MTFIIDLIKSRRITVRRGCRLAPRANLLQRRKRMTISISMTGRESAGKGTIITIGIKMRMTMMKTHTTTRMAAMMMMTTALTAVS